MLQAAKIMESQEGSFTVLYPQEAVMEVFEMTQFDRFIHIVREGEETDSATMAYYPLRPIQRWLTDTHFRRAKSTMMNAGALVSLDPAVDLERLATAVNGLLEAYDIFRCRLVFHPDTGELCQRFDGKVAKVYVESLSEEGLEQRKQELKQPYVQGRVWTTDALYRETKNQTALRQQEGCLAVDMELAGVQAVCSFHGFSLYNYLITGDVLDAEEYTAEGLREANHTLKHFYLALEIAKKLM